MKVAKADKDEFALVAGFINPMEALFDTRGFSRRKNAGGTGMMTMRTRSYSLKSRKI